MIGATRLQPIGMLSLSLASPRFSDGRGKPIRQVPRPNARAARIRLSAAGQRGDLTRANAFVCLASSLAAAPDDDIDCDRGQQHQGRGHQLDGGAEAQ